MFLVSLMRRSKRNIYAEILVVTLYISYAASRVTPTLHLTSLGFLESSSTSRERESFPSEIYGGWWRVLARACKSRYVEEKESRSDYLCVKILCRYRE